MNEEEKQAIEYLKHSIFEYEEIDTSVMEYIDKNHKIIYKLILKQQKEIEDLKNDHIDFWINTKEVEDMVRGKFINKDKIKEKIKYYHKQREKAETEKINDMFVNYIDCLEELLQGGQESDQEGG